VIAQLLDEHPDRVRGRLDALELEGRERGLCSLRRLRVATGAPERMRQGEPRLADLVWRLRAREEPDGIARE